jgi:tetratricopeptide (TPR) repeat protein
MPEKNIVEVIIRAKDDATKKLKSLNVSLKQVAVGAGIAAAAMAAAAVAVFKFTEAVAKQLDILNKASIQTGLSVETLSQLRFAADQNKTSFESLQRSLLIFSRNLFDLTLGIGEVKEVLPALGIEIKDLAGLSTEQAFDKFAKAIGNIEDAGKRTAVSMRVFGRAGGDLVPLFVALAKGTVDYAEISDRMGITIRTETAKDAEALVDALGLLDLQMKGLQATLAGVFMPAITELVVGLQDAAAATNDLARETDGLGEKLSDIARDAVETSRRFIEIAAAARPLAEIGEPLGKALLPMVRFLEATTDLLLAIDQLKSRDTALEGFSRIAEVLKLTSVGAFALGSGLDAVRRAQDGFSNPEMLQTLEQQRRALEDFERAATRVAQNLANNPAFVPEILRAPEVPGPDGGPPPDGAGEEAIPSANDLLAIYGDIVEETLKMNEQMQRFKAEQEDIAANLGLGPTLSEAFDIGGAAAELELLAERFGMGPTIDELTQNTSSFTEGLDFAQQSVRNLGTTMLSAITSGVKGFGSLGDSVADFIADLGKAIIKLVIFQVLLKSIGGPFGALFKGGGSVSPFPATSLAAGGHVVGGQSGFSIAGSGGPDRVPALLSAGEVVLPTIGGLKPADVVSELATLGKTIRQAIAGGASAGTTVIVQSLDSADGVREAVRHGAIDAELQKAFELGK